ncbi:MAG: thiamine pyrophosphate-dependent enzyme [Terracidiphilus sp.]|jgi:pyruvate dehydrogenase E1 component alpha subunit
MPLKTTRQAAASEPVSAENGFSPISNQKLLELYAAMLKSRMLEERIKAERVSKLNGHGAASFPWEPARGREAVSVGVLIDLVSEDTITSQPGSHIPFFLKGVPLSELLKALTRPIAAPSQAASWQPEPGIAEAVAAAGVNKASKNRKIAVAYPGRGPAARRTWQEAISHASQHGLPMIFVSHSALPPKTNPETCPALPVDGHDVVAVYRVASESIARARQGRGPTLIECKRWQSADMVHNRDNNPIHNMEKYLARKGLFTAALRTEIVAGFRRELDAAVSWVRD